VALAVFVCTGNTCRSPIAEGVARRAFLNHPEIQFLSAGLSAVPGAAAAPEAVAAAAVLGADIRSHRSRPVQPGMMAGADLVIAMARSHAEALGRRFPAFRSKIATLGELAGLPDSDVPDPIGESPAVYRRTAEQIAQQLAAGRPAILQRLGLAA